jgi:hypothetical protein
MSILPTGPALLSALQNSAGGKKRGGDSTTATALSSSPGAGGAGCRATTPAGEVAGELGLKVSSVYKYTHRVKLLLEQEYRHVLPPN